MRSFLACIAILASALPTLAEGFSPDDPLYRDIKQAEEAMFDGKAFPMWPEDIRDIENLTFDLIHCGSPIYQTDISSDRTEIGLESVAHWVTYWKRNLARIGFPKDIWLPIVDGLEKEALARLPAESIEHPDHDGSSIAIVDYDRLAPLLAALDRYRAEKDRKLPPVVADGACGDGLVEVRYALVPPEGTLFVLSEIRFQLCKVKGLDPYRLCRRPLPLHGRMDRRHDDGRHAADDLRGAGRRKRGDHHKEERWLTGSRISASSSASSPRWAPGRSAAPRSPSSPPSSRSRRPGRRPASHR